MKWLTKYAVIARKLTVTSLILLTVLLLATSCVSGHVGTTDLNDTRLTCSGWHPICPSNSDVDKISNSLYNQLLEHNKFGSAACGWSPKDCK